MNFAKYRILVLLICMSLLSATAAFALSEGYQTPDSWGEHQTLNGTKFTMDGMTVGTGTLKLGLTSRYTNRMADEGQQYFYQYLRAYLSDFEIGKGTMRIALNARAATDIDGQNKNLHAYHFAPTIMDTLLPWHENDWDLRLYDGNVVLDKVIPYTKLTAGRFRVDYLTEHKVDGGELLVGTDKYNVYGYYGLPVSYYDPGLNTNIAGGGANVFLLDDKLKIRAEVAAYMGDDKDNDTPNGTDTMTWKARADYAYTLSDIANFAPYGEIGAVEKAFMFEVGVNGDVLKSGTTYNLWLKGKSGENDEIINPIASDYEYVLGPQSDYTSFGLNLYQGLFKYFAVGAGYEMRFNAEETFYDRSYNRVTANLDFFNMIPDNYISVYVDYYMLPSVNKAGLRESSKMLFGGRITQDIMKVASVWLGATMLTYEDQDHPMLVTPLIGYDDKAWKENVTTMYLGGLWNITERLKITADYNYEVSNIIKKFDKDNGIDTHNDTIQYVELWLNIAL